MAKSQPPSALSTTPAKAVAELERPEIKWKVIAQIAAGVALVWVTCLILVPYSSYWVLSIAGVVTVVVAGFGVYVWRLTRRSQAIVDIIKGATDETERQKAIDKLAEGGSKDAMKALARAQLVAQSKPAEALEILESIDIAKAPAVIQDDIRSQLTLLYLRNNRVREARETADLIRLDRQPNVKAKALYAAVMAESFARTGKAEEAQKLMETYPPEDPAYGEARALLLRARVFTYFVLKKRGLTRKSMEALSAMEPGLLGAFIQKGTQPELTKMAREVLSQSGIRPKPKIMRS
jgi:hypothetical protein